MGDEVEIWNKSFQKRPLIAKHCILPEEGTPGFIMLPRPKAFISQKVQAEGASTAYLGLGYARNYHPPPQILGPPGDPVLVLGLENGMENGTNVSEDELPGELVKVS